MPKKNRPYILITNDDGIEAPGIEALADALSPDYDLLIIAPHRERSATAHAITILRALKLEKYSRNGSPFGWAFGGKPADCVKVGVKLLAHDRKLDLVIAGINRGQNLGRNILYSGTVGAAREGVLMGVPSIAFSLTFLNINDVDFAASALVAREITARAIEHGMPDGVFLNVNVPPCSFADIRGYAITRQGTSGFKDKFIHAGPDDMADLKRLRDVEEAHLGPDGDEWMLRNVGARFERSTDDADNLDDHAVYSNKVSITPLHVDTTAHHHLESLEHMLVRPGEESSKATADNSGVLPGAVPGGLPTGPPSDPASKADPPEPSIAPGEPAQSP